MLACLFFCLMIRRPPRSTQSRSSAASDVYKRQDQDQVADAVIVEFAHSGEKKAELVALLDALDPGSVSYTHLRAHETVLDLVCRLLLEKKKNKNRLVTDYMKPESQTKNH